MSRGRRIAAPLSGALLCLALLTASGCGDTLGDQPIGNAALEQLVSVDRYPVYWLGARFRGMAITGVARDSSGAYTIQYGDCRVGGQVTCVTPLQVVTSPDNSFRAEGTTARRIARVRGVHAIVAQHGHTIELPTGGVVVNLYADTARLARGAAETVVPINRVGLPGAPLPAALPNTGYANRPLPGQAPPPVRTPAS
jgi:hypothetical protein